MHQCAQLCAPAGTSGYMNLEMAGSDRGEADGDGHVKDTVSVSKVSGTVLSYAVLMKIAMSDDPNQVVYIPSEYTNVSPGSKFFDPRLSQ